MTESNTDTQPLTDEAVDEILARAGDKWTVNKDTIRALCATVKQLRAEREKAIKILSPDVPRTDLCDAARQIVFAHAMEKGNAEKLQSQLEQLRAENQQLKLIVDVGTNDDPGTALSKLHRIQHVAATAMRDKCVEKVKAMRKDWQVEADARRDPDAPHDYKGSYGLATGSVDACDDIITALESLTLDPLEPEKQK